MFFRSKDVKGSKLVQLVESYRNKAGQPRQRIIASLGDAQIPETEQVSIAKAVERRLLGQEDLFDEQTLSSEGAAWVARIVALAQRSKGGNEPLQTSRVDGVLIDQLQTQEVVELGPQLVALKAWEELGLSALLQERGLNASAIATAQMLVANRLIQPLSEWASIDWAQRTALPELLGLSLTKSGKDRLYRVGDELLKHRVKIEETLCKKERDLFSLQRSIILYDVTNTHFEGLCEANPKARHGKNKQHRDDCRQVAVGMAFDEYGFALAHEVFDGNTADTSTLKEMLKRLQVPDESLKPVVILDAGFASQSNLEALRQGGYSYLVNMTRSSRTKYADQFDSEDFETIQERDQKPPVEVKKITDPDDCESDLLLCRSLGRREKEQAMLSRAEERFLKDLQALAKSIEKGTLKRAVLIERKIGALQKKHPRVRRFYTVELRDGRLHWELDEPSKEQALHHSGEYVLKTDRKLEPAQLWNLYMTLLKAEDGFRMLKGSLGLRPNFHQLERRVEAHIFISVLAYHLLMWVRHHLDQRGDPRDWITVRRILRTHSLVTTLLPLTDGQILRVRKPSLPDAEQQSIFDKLGIDWKAAAPCVKSIKKA